MTAAFTVPAIVAAMLVSPLLLLPATSAAAESCFSFGDEVTMTGRYESAGGIGGAALLLLATPICVDGDIISAGVAAASSIQFHCPLVDAAPGSTLALTGRLMGAHTGNGHTPVLLACGL